MGPTQYFASYWNTFDFCVTILGILALILEIVGIPLSYVIILRPLRYVNIQQEELLLSESQMHNVL